jgi:ribosomal RNA assembly protein
MFEESIKIPKPRVAVLIGKKGEIKKLIARKTKTRLKVSKEGEVIIFSEENINIFNVLPIIQAIARGFNPDIALTLLDENICLEVISLKEFLKTEKAIIRIRSRIIGRNGRARIVFEKLSNTFVSVYGKTVAIIGKIEDAALAKRAMIKLIQGAPHGNVYNYIGLQTKKSLEQ